MFRFWKDIQSQKGSCFNILCMRSPGVRGTCANALLCDSLSCQSLGFSVETEYSNETKVERKRYKLIQVFHILPHFEMYLYVILSCDSAQGERPILPYMGIGMSSLRGYVFF